MKFLESPLAAFLAGIVAAAVFVSPYGLASMMLLMGVAWLYDVLSIELLP